MTPPSNLNALFSGSPQSNAPSDDPNSDTLSGQIQALQVQAMMIARSNPALAQSMRQIIQLSQAALQQAATAQSNGGGQPAGPVPAEY